MSSAAEKRESEFCTSRKNGSSPKARWVEWIAGTLSALVVVLMLSWVAWEAITEDPTPPDFAIAIMERVAVERGFRVVFDIANTSNQTAAAVVVRGEIIDGATTIETADVTFDYVPGGSKETGVILFSQDPGTRTLRVRPMGYVFP